MIVVIGILAALVLNSFSSAQTRAQNTSKLSELKIWHKLFEAYRSTEGNLPVFADGGYCLGSGFPIGGGGVARCRDYGSVGASSYLESDNTAITTEIVKVGTIPTSVKQQINGTVGPYATYTATQVILMMVIKGSASECPAPTVYAWDDGLGRLLCKITLTK